MSIGHFGLMVNKQFLRYDDRYDLISKNAVFADPFMDGNVTLQSNLRPQLSGPGCPTYSGGKHKDEPREFIYESDLPWVQLRSSRRLYHRYGATFGLRIVRISFYGLGAFGSEGKLKVPQGLRSTSRHNAEAGMLNWLAKRLPEKLSTGFLPPSNHKIWSDRTWKLFLQLEASLGS
jgi:hypothetical protein